MRCSFGDAASMGQEWNRRRRGCAELDGPCASSIKEGELFLKPTARCQDLFGALDVESSSPSSCSFGAACRRLLLSLLLHMVAIQNADLPRAQDAANNDGSVAACRSSALCAQKTTKPFISDKRYSQRQPHVFIQKQISESNLQGWHKVGTRLMLARRPTSPFRGVGVVSVFCQRG